MEPPSGNCVWGLRRTDASIGQRRAEIRVRAAELGAKSWKAGLGRQDSADCDARMAHEST